MKSPAFVILAILLLSSSLTGCKTASRQPLVLPFHNLHQTPVLRIPAGQPVQTLDGLYTPTENETWHSDARVRKTDAQIEALVIANLQLQQQLDSRR